MKDKLLKIINTRQFHISMVVLIMFCIIMIVGMVTLKYNVEGDSNLPFYLSKISIISNIEGTDNKEDTENKWSLSVNQNNDIYLYVKKNDKYKNTEVIDSIILDNFNIIKNNSKGEIKLYKPDGAMENTIFKNSEDNETNQIEYAGSMDSSIKDLKIANQGGLVVFRYAVNNIGTYVSNDDDQINHSELLKKLGINNEEIKFQVSFDMYINLNSDKKYKSTINLELPVNDVVNGGVQSFEDEELTDVMFKRI